MFALFSWNPRCTAWLLIQGDSSSCVEWMRVYVPTTLTPVVPFHFFYFDSVWIWLFFYLFSSIIFIEKQTGHLINPLRPAHIAKEHTDIVKVVLCYESRVYSVGYESFHRFLAGFICGRCLFPRPKTAQDNKSWRKFLWEFLKYYLRTFSAGN